jgi:hypothetical protein
MSTDLASFQVSKYQSAHAQIERQMRREILSGGLPPGTRLPTLQELSETWGVSAATVNTALIPLAKEGLLVRRRKLGTFVAEKSKKLRRAGIYYGGNFGESGGFLFLGLLHKALCADLAQREIEARILIDSRPVAQQAELYEPLLEAIEEGQIDCIIGPMLNRYDILALKKVSLPSAFYTGLTIPNKAQFDWRQFLHLSLDQLQAQGCRSVGLISSVEIEDLAQGREPFFSHFIELAHERGLNIRNEWVKGPESWLPEADMEQFGYDQVRRILEQSERPGGLVVYPDVSVRGVILGLIQLGVNVPTDLRLVLHRNQGIDFPCPFPACRPTSRATDLAGALLTQIDRQINGEPVKAIYVPHYI